VLKPITGPITVGDISQFLQSASSQSVTERIFQDWSILVSVSILASLIFGALTIYNVIRLAQVRRHEEAVFAAAVHPVAAKDVSRTQLRWSAIQQRAHSEDEQGWRLAILEADILLNELLDVLGYRGETMADKMKQASRAQFQTIDLAWEAHKVRNSIAHQGSLHTLTAYETRRVISLYTKVFQEFNFIK